MNRKIGILPMKLKRPYIPVIEKEEIPFFLSYIVFLVYAILDATFYSQYISSIWKILFVYCIGMLAVCELIKNGLSWKSLIFLGVIVFLFVNITRISHGLGQRAVALLLLYMFCVRSFSFRKVCWFTMLFSGITLAFVVISSLIGRIPNYVEQGERQRQYLGFLYALYGPALMSNLTLIWLYIKKEKVTLKGVFFFLLLNFFFYYRTNSRLCFFLTAFMLLLGLFLRKHKKMLLRRKVLCFGMILSFDISAIISFIMTMKYNPSISWMSSLNKALGSRLSLGQESLRLIGIKPLGIEGIQWVGNGLNMYGEKSNETYLYVDNYYIQIAQRFGYVFLIIVLLFMTVTCYKAYKNEDIYLLCIFTLLAIHSLIDNLYMHIQYNTFWLAAGMMVFSRHNDINKQSILEPLLG